MSNAVAKSYLRGELCGVGYETDYGGVRVHVIAWANAEVERLRDDPLFTEGLVIDSIGCLAVPLDYQVAFEEQATKPLKARIAELEAQIAQEAKHPKNWGVGGPPDFDTVENPEPIITSPAYLNGAYLGDVVSMSPPEVIATHETIEPAISETPVEPIQEPVAGVSELTASPPAQAPDTVEAVSELKPAECVLGPHWEPTPGDSEAATIRSFLKRFGDLPNKSVIETLAKFGVVVTSSQVLLAKKAVKQ